METRKTKTTLEPRITLIPSLCSRTGLVFILAVICLFGLPVQGALYSGGGTEADPYIISTAAEMNDIGNNPNDFSSYFLLTADIDLGGYTGTSFNIIGPNSTTMFTGVFDGNGHTISNFTYDSNGIDYIGLFGLINDPNAEIKNLGLIDPNVDAGTENYVCSLVGYLRYGAITDCTSVGGSVSGGSRVGRLVGENWKGTVSNSYSVGDVNGNNNIGGLVGRNSGSISYCYSRGSVSGGSNVGGLAGSNSGSGTVSNSYATASVSGDGFVGGLIGYNSSYGTVSNSYSIGDVNGTTNVGGLVGFDNSGNYTKSFWDNTVNPSLNGIGNTADANVIGESTANMQTESTFTNAGWDFVGEVINGPNDIWDICEGTNYPKLAWQIPLPGDFVCPDGVNFVDFAILGLAWGSEQGDGNWNPACNISEPNDNVIDTLDLDVFTNNWLAGI